MQFPSGYKYFLTLRATLYWFAVTLSFKLTQSCQEKSSTDSPHYRDSKVWVFPVICRVSMGHSLHICVSASALVDVIEVSRISASTYRNAAAESPSAQTQTSSFFAPLLLLLHPSPVLFHNKLHTKARMRQAKHKPKLLSFFISLACCWMWIYFPCR